MIAALLAIACTSSFSATPKPVDELPLDEWIERADSLSPVAFRYRMTNSEGETSTLDVAVESQERATLRYRADGLSHWVVVRDGLLNQIHQSAEGPPTGTRIDFNEASVEPRAWLTQTLESLDFPERTMSAARMYMSIWPAEEGKGTWAAEMSCGMGDDVEFMWLAKLRNATFEAERVGETFVVRLASGAELTLDAASGFLRRAVIDPEDEAAGLVELLHLDLDPDMDAEPFGYEIPDDVQAEWEEAALESSKQMMWDLQRIRVIMLVIKAEAKETDWLDGHHDILVERFGAHYTTRHTPQIARTVEHLEPQTDRMTDKLAAWYEENKNSPNVEEGLVAAKEHIRVALRRECERNGEQMATAVVVSPFESGDLESDSIEPDDEDLSAFLTLEHKAAAEALGAAFLEPCLAHANERLDELGAGPLRQ